MHNEAAASPVLIETMILAATSANKPQHRKRRLSHAAPHSLISHQTGAGLRRFPFQTNALIRNMRLPTRIQPMKTSVPVLRAFQCHGSGNRTNTIANTQNAGNTESRMVRCKREWEPQALVYAPFSTTTVWARVDQTLSSEISANRYQSLTALPRLIANCSFCYFCLEIVHQAMLAHSDHFA
jgi:hypothetical protein